MSLKDMNSTKIIRIELEDHLLHDKLHFLAMEYTISIDSLTSIAIRRLLDDVNFFRGLRMGVDPFGRSTHPNEQT